MKETIRFRGLTLNKDEQSAEHGELALCAGVEMHDGALRASVLQGTDVGNIPGTLVYVHVTASYTHYISIDSGYMKWSNGGYSSSNTISGAPGSGVVSITSVGNTLVVMTSSGIHYILWKDSTYNYLGTEIPFVRLQFRPTVNKTADYDISTLSVTHTEYIDNPSRSDAWRELGFEEYAQNYVVAGTDVVNIKSDNGQQAKVTEAVWALINQANDVIAKDGHFYAPFMIRYCYRLYDGSMIMHSAPIFMDVSLPLAYKVYSCNVQRRDESPYSIIVFGDDVTLNVFDGSNLLFETNKFTLRYRPNNVGISFRLVNWTVWNTLQTDWADIVKSVDIFVTPPITREDSSQIIKRMVVESYQKGVRESYMEQWKTTYGTSYDGANYKESLVFDIPQLSNDAYRDKILGQSSFYKIKSFNLDDTLSTVWTEMDYDKSIIPYIAAQEQMTDDYKTHNTLQALTNDKSGLYVYNHRLNVYGIQEKLFSGFAIEDMVNPCSYNGNQVTVDKIMVELNTESGKRYVENSVSATIPVFILTSSPLFYPDTRAVRMVVYYTSGSTSYAVSFAMQPCALLNGAITMPEFLQSNITDYVSASSITYTVSRLVPMPNKVYTSEVDNPYYFPLNGINTIGTGNIIGIAAVTRALSQGQVGDHDLIVFSTDGIWVMKVASTGTYSALHNISREVCSNPKSICQLDQSVTFATKRALARFVESDVINMSEELDGPVPNWTTLLPSLLADFPVNGTAINTLLKFSTQAVTMFNSGKVVYDHAGMRVLVLPSLPMSADGVALVWSTRDRTWSTMAIPALKAVVAGYPYPYVQLYNELLTTGKVTVLDKAYDYDNGEGSEEPGLVISRTLTFSDTMDVLRGFQHYTDSATAPWIYLYGSNDQRSWTLLGKTNRWHCSYLPGKPFRWFRIAVYMRMKPSEEYQQLEVEVVNKFAKL